MNKYLYVAYMRDDKEELPFLLPKALKKWAKS